jgi:superfamily II DNA/RNA helicase
VVINYDIPWNPTRMMQRVGRINRVDTKFDTIYTFNFLPTTQANNEIGLKEAAEAKINAFLSLLGGDAALLTEGEPVGSHELFDRLVSKKTITGEDGTETSELKYLALIKDIRDNDEDLFERIKRLPRKARSGKNSLSLHNSLLTYFRKGKVQKFFIAGDNLDAWELDLIAAAETLACAPDEKREKVSEAYYDLLDKNKDAFIVATTEEAMTLQTRKGRDSSVSVLRILSAVFKNTKQLTEEQEAFVQNVMEQLKVGGLPKQTIKTTLKTLNANNSDWTSPLKVLGLLRTTIPAGLLGSHYVDENPRSAGKREVILSMYLK